MWSKMETASKCLLMMLETQICIWTLKLSYFSAAGHETPHTASTKYVRIANNVDQNNEFWWFNMRQLKKLPSPAVCPALLPEITAPNRIGKIGGTCASQRKPLLLDSVLSKCYQPQFLLMVLFGYYSIWKLCFIFPFAFRSGGYWRGESASPPLVVLLVNNRLQKKWMQIW